MSGQVNLSSLTAIPVSSGSVSINVTWTISLPVDVRTQLTLNSGANTITVPTGATVAIIIPPTTNTQTITAKGVTGDTGIPLGIATPTLLSLNANTTFVLTAGGSIPLTEVVFL